MTSRTTAPGAPAESRDSAHDGELLAFLADPRTHGLGGGRARVRVIETHFAWVFLAGRGVLKLKKPLRQWPLDYRRLASRRRGCQAELALNRRLAPRVYRDVVAVVRRRDGRLALGGAGRTVDWVVRMRRLPATRMLDATLAAGREAAARRRLTDLVHRLVVFYGRDAAPAPMGRSRYLRRARERLGANARVLAARRYGLDATLVRRVLRAQAAALQAIAPALGARGARVVEGHGDLRPEHVCLTRRVDVIDVLEFDRGLRLYDPLEEVAFLVMECRLLGARRFARRLLRQFVRESDDAAPDSVLHFYMSHRAAVRARISAWHLRPPSHGDRIAWVDRAERYLVEALVQARAALRASRRDPRATRRGRPVAAPRRAAGRPAAR